MLHRKEISAKRMEIWEDNRRGRDKRKKKKKI